LIAAAEKFTFSNAGAIAFTAGSLRISLSGLAVGALMGIVLNAILPGKDFAFSETAPHDQGHRPLRRRQAGEVTAVCCYCQNE
jgi:hypothetical protein